MTEKKVLDLRGLSCPQPVLQTKQSLKEMKNGTVEVLVDTGAPRDNVTRFAKGAGWNVTAEEQPDGSLRLTLKK